MKRVTGFCLIIVAGVLTSAPSSAQQMAFAPQAERPRTVLDAIFGAFRRPQPRVVYEYAPPTPPASIQRGKTRQQMTIRTAAPDSGPKSSKTSGGVSRRGGGGVALCVRTCDGFYFPVNYEGARGDDRYAEACQASCPNAETEVYFKSQSADIDRATNAQGRNYSQLPNAFKYRSQRDNACTCKRDGETWAEALKGADAIIGSRKSDIIVTAQQSAEMARPTVPAKTEKTARTSPRLAAGQTTVQ